MNGLQPDNFARFDYAPAALRSARTVSFNTLMAWFGAHRPGAAAG